MEMNCMKTSVNYSIEMAVQVDESSTWDDCHAYHEKPIWCSGSQCICTVHFKNIVSTYLKNKPCGSKFRYDVLRKLIVIILGEYARFYLARGREDG